MARTSSWLVAWMALLLASAAPALAGTDPEREWFVVETEHFAVYSYDGGEALARDVAAYCEEAWATLNPIVGWDPREKVHVKVVDEVDSANGFAFVSPYNAFTVYAFPPPAESELGNYANWMKLLVFHEYTHILHLDATGGLPDFFNRLLGRAFKPNEALPRWVTEGIAVWIESTTTGGGRVGSSRFEMFLRTAVLRDRLPSIADLTGPPLEHPRGASWYLYGGYVFDRIAREAGAQAVRDFVAAYGRRSVPYAINLTARRTTGKGLDVWFDEVLAGARERTAAVLARVEAAGGPVEGEALTEGGEFKVDPRFSPDGRALTYVLSDGHSPARLVVAPAGEPARAEDVIRCEGGCASPAYTRDGTEILYGTTRHYRYVNLHGALARVPARPDLGRREARLLPHGLRGAQPVVAADGRGAWFVDADWGETRLTAVDLATGDVLARITPPARARLDHPAVHPDGRSLFVTMHHDGNRDLYRVDLATETFERLTADQTLELSPTVTADGRWLVYSADVDGVYDVYARDLTGDAGTRRLTRVLTGAFDPAVSPDGRWLVYARWSGEGFELHRLPFSPLASPAAPAERRAPLPAEPPAPAAATRRDYQRLPTMLPRSWVPTWTADSTGLNRLGLSFAGVDAAGTLAATVSAEWDFPGEDLAAFASATISTSFPDLTLSAGRYAWDRTSFVGDQSAPYREEVWYGSANVNLPIPSVFTGLNVGMGYTVAVARALESEPGEHRPDEFTSYVPYEGVDTAVNLYWSLSDVESFTFSVSPQLGLSSYMSLRLRDPAVGSTGTNYTLKWIGRAYLPGLFDDHALSLRLEAGLSGGDASGRSVFSIGGPPQQDLLTDLINQTSAGAVWLRGFAAGAFTGTSFALLTAEYRLPLLRVRAGLDALPLFVEDVSLAAFSDVAGVAWAPFDRELVDDLHASAGLELRWNMTLFFGLASTFRLGWAHGFGEGGADQFYLLMAPQP